jgi:general secretion pathway protein F
MPNFSYEAASADGHIVRGVLDAPSRASAVERLLAQGQTPIHVSEAGEGGRRSWRGAAALFPRLSLESERLALVRELSILLRAGLTVERALMAMHGAMANVRLKALLARLTEGLRAGQPLSSAMAQAPDLFPDAMRKLVAAGEMSGRLPDVLTRLATAQARNKELRDRAVSALIYPALLTMVMFFVLIMIFTVVIPRLEPLFVQAGNELPWPAVILLAISHFFNSFGLLVTVLLIAALGAALYYLRQPHMLLALDRAAVTSRFVLQLPLRYEAAQFCRNLGMLLDGGLPLNRALEAAQAASSNRFVRERLNVVLDGVRQGASLKAAIGRMAVFPPLMIEFAAVGEETGRLPAMLNEVANIFDGEVQTRLDRLSALLLPTVTIALGLIVAVIMTGVVSGILAANDLAF